MKVDDQSNIVFVVCKVVDDVSVVGSRYAVTEFHKAPANRILVEWFVLDHPLIFNRLHISQDRDGIVHASMKEYKQKIQPLTLSRDRRKQFHEKR